MTSRSLIRVLTFGVAVFSFAAVASADTSFAPVAPATPAVAQAASSDDIVHTSHYKVSGRLGPIVTGQAFVVRFNQDAIQCPEVTSCRAWWSDLGGNVFIYPQGDSANPTFLCPNLSFPSYCDLYATPSRGCVTQAWNLWTFQGQPLAFDINMEITCATE